MNRLVILGAGGHGSVVADIGESRWPDTTIVFLDDRFPVLARHWAWPVIGKLDEFAAHIGPETGFLVAIGNNRVRHEWIERLRTAGAAIPTLVHPSATVSRHATIGDGTVVCPQAVINIGARLGRACIINTAAVVEHDCVLGNAVHVCPKAALAGGVSVGSRTTLGVGSAIRHGAKIGDDAFVGAGAAVVCDIQSGLTVVGVPAKPIQSAGATTKC